MFVGDGSFLMMNSDLYSSVLSGHPMIVIVCDNGGFAVIDRLQVNQGGASFNNLLADVRTPGEPVRVDFAARRRRDGLRHRGGVVRSPSSAPRSSGPAGADRTMVIVIATDPHAWTEGGAWWEVGVPETSDQPTIRDARAALDEARAEQRVGI